MAGRGDNRGMRMSAGFALAAVVAAALSGCVALPAPWQLGGGVSHTSLHTDYSALGDQDTSSVDVVASWGFTRTWWLDTYASFGTDRLETGTTQNIYYPPDSAHYLMFALNLRKEWPAEGRRVTPWLSGGVGLGDASWETYWYSVAGFGPVLGAGFDASLGRSPLALRVQLQGYRFSGEDSYGYGPYHLNGVTGSMLLVWTIGGEDNADH